MTFLSNISVAGRAAWGAFWKCVEVDSDPDETDAFSLTSVVNQPIVHLLSCTVMCISIRDHNTDEVQVENPQVFRVPYKYMLTLIIRHILCVAWHSIGNSFRIELIAIKKILTCESIAVHVSIIYQPNWTNELSAIKSNHRLFIDATVINT